jgi:hypothetical protein
MVALRKAASLVYRRSNILAALALGAWISRVLSGWHDPRPGVTGLMTRTVIAVFFASVALHRVRRERRRRAEAEARRVAEARQEVIRREIVLQRERWRETQPDTPTEVLPPFARAHWPAVVYKSLENTADDKLRLALMSDLEPVTTGDLPGPSRRRPAF